MLLYLLKNLSLDFIFLCLLSKYECAFETCFELFLQKLKLFKEFHDLTLKPKLQSLLFP